MVEVNGSFRNTVDDHVGAIIKERVQIGQVENGLHIEAVVARTPRRCLNTFKTYSGCRQKRAYRSYGEISDLRKDVTIEARQALRS